MRKHKNWWTARSTGIDAYEARSFDYKEVPNGTNLWVGVLLSEQELRDFWFKDEEVEDKFEMCADDMARDIRYHWYNKKIATNILKKYFSSKKEDE